MESINIVLLTLILAASAKIVYKRVFLFVNSEFVKSDIDGMYYRVRSTKNKQKSADTLAIINKRVSILLDILKKEVPENKNIKLLLQRYRSHSLMENIEMDNTTYTVNKGQEVAVCLSTRDPFDEKIYDINKLMFVIIHELTHIGCESQGHNGEFRTFFIFLLKKSIDAGIYNYQDYSEKPEEYCDITINSTPLKAVKTPKEK